MLEKYQEELESLPKGTITEKDAGGRVYYYLKYRCGKKGLFQYVAKDKIDVIREQINRRRHIKAMLQSLKREKEIADKILKGAV